MYYIIKLRFFLNVPVLASSDAMAPGEGDMLPGVAGGGEVGIPPQPLLTPQDRLPAGEREELRPPRPPHLGGVGCECLLPGGLP